MKISRRAIMAGTTFLLAAATGHVMQNSGHIFASNGTPEFIAVAVPSVADAAPEPEVSLPPDTPIVQLSADLTQTDGGDLPDLPQLDAPTFADTQSLSARMRFLEQAPGPATLPSDDKFSAFGLQCGPSTIQVSAAPKAMIQVKLDAPCHENQTVTLTHAGLNVSLQTDAKGQVALTIPAFAADGAVSAQIGSDDVVTGNAPIIGLDRYARMAVVSLTSEPVALNIFENGADVGGAGHITAEHPRNTKSRRGGQLFAFGDAGIESGYRTEVYQYSSKTKSLRMEVVAEATSETCGTEVSGRVIGLKRGKLSSHDITVAMPECGDANAMMVMDVTPSANVAVASAKKP